MQDLGKRQYPGEAMLKVLYLKSCNETPILSIIVLNYNSSKFFDVVKDSVQSILQIPLTKEIVIVDNVVMMVLIECC